MSRYHACVTLTDEKLGADTLADIECEAEISLEWQHGEPVASVDAIYIAGKNLFLGSGFSVSLGAELANKIEAELDAGGDLFDRVLEHEGIYATAPFNHPDSRLARAF